MERINDKAKELCEKSACHHKCHDTKDCVVEDEALLLITENKSNNSDFKSNKELFKQALVEGVNRHIDKDLQIEEMMQELCVDYPTRCQECKYHDDGIYTECMVMKRAVQILYNAGYRKQSEGEWLDTDIYAEDMYCSVCGGIAPVDCEKEAFFKSNYCPNCGAKMKGGEE